MKTAIFYFFTFFLSVHLFSQFDTTKLTEFDQASNPYNDDFYIEYLNTRLKHTKKKKGLFKCYAFYQKNERCTLYPELSLFKRDKLFLNNKEIKHSSPVTTMNGLYCLKDKNKKIFEEIYFVNGFIKKHVVRNRSIFYPKRTGKIICEIAEFDYSAFPFVLHYIQYDRHGNIIKNYYYRYKNALWKAEETDDLISPDF
jgi:hypothetical protein